MFNRAPANVHTSVKIEENKAPTDESIRLLNEMQEKAIKNLVAQYTVKCNDSISLSKDALITSLYKGVSKVITEELFKNFDGGLENFSE